jgi:hypothetical protein
LRLLAAGDDKWYGVTRRGKNMKVSVELSPADTERLRDKASRLGVAPERLAHAAISDLLAREHDDFEAAAKRVLEKNRELYRRLA